MDELQHILQTRFGYKDFREGQREIIEKVLAGEDVVAILPTGMGKSLLFQLPAYLKNGAVLIVSPLLSLMQDQVEQLKMMGEKRVVAINSFLSFEQRERALSGLQNYKFIFTSPEMLQNERFQRRLASLNLAFIVADEAHCISQWGFDFRPDYLRISESLKSLRKANVLALTATATKEVVKEIKTTLLMEQPFEYIHSLDRPYIAYEAHEVESQKEKVEWILNRITSTTGPGILYSQSRKKTEFYTEELQKKGIRVAYYHSKMDQDDRILIQQQFQQGHLDWICATNAFGMGIHKDNIRQIIHDHIPTSVANYMQEVGRAGRDGKQSIASILYMLSDVEQAYFVAMQDFPDEQDIILAYQTNENQVQLSETTERILDYWKMVLSTEETIELFKNIRQKKWIEIQSLYTLLQNENCIREQVIAYFDQKLIAKPLNCCSKCSLNLQELFHLHDKPLIHATVLDWKSRLGSIL